MSSGTATTEAKLFEQAEYHLAQNDVKAALTAYATYLSRFPLGRQADNALRRLGAIYFQQKDYPAAQAFYQKMIDQFPFSLYIGEARLAVLDCVIAAHRDAEAIRQAMHLLEGELTAATRRQVWRRLVKLHHSAGQHANAARYEHLLLKSAPSVEREELREQLADTIASLTPTDLDELWDSVPDTLLRGFLLHRYAVLRVQADKFGDAKEMLTSFQNDYVDHPLRGEATELLQTVTQKLQFQPATLGCLLPLSGPYQAYGQQALNGLQMALARWQAADPQSAVKLIIKDSASTQQTIGTAIQELANAQVGAIIGPLSEAEAAARQAQKLNIPLVTLTQKSEITAIGDFIFRHFITPQNQVKTLVDYLVGKLGVNTFAILYPRETYGQTFMNLFWDQVVEHGGQVVGVHAYAPQQTDFTDVIKELMRNDLSRGAGAAPSIIAESGGESSVTARNSGGLSTADRPKSVSKAEGSGSALAFDEQGRIVGVSDKISTNDPKPASTTGFEALFIPDTPQKTQMVLSQLVLHDLGNVYLVGTNLWHSDQFLPIAAGYAGRTLMVDGFFQESRSSEAHRFSEEYRSIFNEEPGLIEALAFDTANFLFSLMKSHPDIHLRHHLRDAMKQQTLQNGATGPTSFDAQGEAIKILSTLSVQDGHFVEADLQ